MSAVSRILLIDGFAASRGLIGIVIRNAFPEAHLVEVSDALALVDSINDSKFSIAIAAPDLPWGSGAEALREVKRSSPDCSTILFGTVDPNMLNGRILRAAVDAVLLNSSRGYIQLPMLIRALTGGSAEGSYRRLETTPTSNGNAHTNPVAQLREELDVHMAMLVHDLQEPLTIIVQNVRQLTAQSVPESSQTRSGQLARITASAERLQAMLDGLKSRAEAAMHVPSFDLVNLNEVLKVVMRHLESQVTDNDASILSSRLPEIVCDHKQMVQLIENLIANSLKFRGEEPPLITIQVIERASEWLLSISDNGIGISTADSERIFNIFQRLHTSEEYPGTGMGLAICRRIALNHNGDIWMQSNPGGGTTFYVSIPKRTNGSLTAGTNNA